MPRLWFPVIACCLILQSQSIYAFPSGDISNADWLVAPIEIEANLEAAEEPGDLTLSNGIISRTFVTSPNFASISLKNHTDRREFIRGVKPEATITIDGESYPIGGLLGQPDYGYLDPQWLKQMTADPGSFSLRGYSTGKIQPRLEWERTRYSADLSWPPKGIHVVFDFQPPRKLVEESPGIELSIHYELYEGIPVYSKWLTLKNTGNSEFTINSVTTEILAVVERESEVQRVRNVRPRKFKNDIDPNDLAAMTSPRLHIQSDYAFCGGSTNSSDQTTFWTADPQYTSQVNYDLTWPHLLTSRYPYGPAVLLKPGESFTSFRTFVLLHDSDDKERRGLAIRRMHRVLAPWVTENPILMHLRHSDSKSIRRAVDQCAEVGFEMIVLSFGSGINMESTDPEYLQRMKNDFDYAYSKGIEIGGYSLLASRSAGPEYNVIDPETGTPGAFFGQSPCLVSEWGENYFRNLKQFIETTGADILEHDGSYPGDLCAATYHKGHRGLLDSQWAQFQKIREFYRWCRARGVYLNVPDYYFLNGSNKTGMGYREVNWSLPRERQIILGRQNIYDGTFEKTPSMGWMFVPLVEYHGGGAAATLEPLSEHLNAYEAHLAQNFGSGVQACYRGPRLYDTEETKQVVKQWVDFYKQYRAILDSDIIHVRRPDGRSIDCMLHVNPQLEERGLAMVYNPLDRKVQTTLELPLYYTGLTTIAHIWEQEEKAKEYKLDRQYDVQIPVDMPPNSVTWFVIE